MLILLNMSSKLSSSYEHLHKWCKGGLNTSSLPFWNNTRSIVHMSILILLSLEGLSCIFCLFWNSDTRLTLVRLYFVLYVGFTCFDGAKSPGIIPGLLGMDIVKPLWGVYMHWWKLTSCVELFELLVGLIEEEVSGLGDWPIESEWNWAWKWWPSPIRSFHELSMNSEIWTRMNIKDWFVNKVMEPLFLGLKRSRLD